MTRYLLSLLCAGAVSSAWAQSPVMLIPTPENKTQVVPASTTRAALAVRATTAPAATEHLSHSEAGCPKTKSVCVPQPDTIIKTKIVFSSDCETKCHKACPLFRRGGDCNTCKDGSCGHAYVERYLYKRVQKEVCDSYKCVPTHVAVCETPKCTTKCAAPGANGTCCPSVVAPGRTVSVMPSVNVPNASGAETLIIPPTRVPR